MNPFAIAGLLLGITCLLLAIFVVIYGKSKLHRIWALFNLAVAIWGIGCFIVGIASTELIALFGWRFAHIGGLFISVFFYHMVCTFCNLERRKSIVTVYSIGIFFLLLNVMTHQFINKTRYVFNLYYNDATLIYSAAVVLWLFLVAVSFIELLRLLPNTKSIKHTQTLYIIWGFLIGFLGGTSNFLPAFKLDIIYPFGNFTIPIYCFISTYAVLRYRLMDIHIAFKKSLVYSISAGILTSVFVVLVLAMTTYLTDLIGITSFWIIVIAALAIAFLFNPLKNRIQTIIDKIFYKTTYDYYATIQKVSHDLVSKFDIQGIYSFIVDTIFSTLKLKSAYLLSAENKYFEPVYFRLPKDKQPDQNISPSPSSPPIKGGEGSLSPNGRRGVLAKDSVLAKFLTNKNELIIKEELPRIIEQERSDIISEELKPFNGEVAVPIFIDNELSHLLILGEKLSGDIFTDEDIKLLNTIANQAAISIKNATLYAEKVLSERLASIGMMSATLAHEIKNPLSSIKVFTQLFPEKYQDIEFRESFSRIVSDEIQRIDGLITELLDFSKKTPINVKEINAQQLIDNTIELITGELESSRIKILKKYHGSFNIAGDAERLKQALLNIFINSRQAMKEGCTLGIELSSRDNYVNISISDDGAGIPENIVDKIFDPFFSTKERGSGLGLAISKKIIDDHGGKITVTSNEGQGTVFELSLPSFNKIEQGTNYGTFSTLNQ